MSRKVSIFLVLAVLVLATLACGPFGGNTSGSMTKPNLVQQVIPPVSVLKSYDCKGSSPDSLSSAMQNNSGFDKTDGAWVLKSDSGASGSLLYEAFGPDNMSLAHHGINFSIPPSSTMLVVNSYPSDGGGTKIVDTKVTFENLMIPSTATANIDWTVETVGTQRVGFPGLPGYGLNIKNKSDYGLTVTDVRALFLNGQDQILAIGTVAAFSDNQTSLGVIGSDTYQNYNGASYPVVPYGTDLTVYALESFNWCYSVAYNSGNPPVKVIYWVTVTTPKGESLVRTNWPDGEIVADQDAWR